MNLTALNIWEGFFRVMMAHGSLILMTGFPGGFVLHGCATRECGKKSVETQYCKDSFFQRFKCLKKRIRIKCIFEKPVLGKWGPDGPASQAILQAGVWGVFTAGYRNVT